MSGIIYLACPYSHEDKGVRLYRAHIATKAAAKLIASGLTVFSPITMTHPIDLIFIAEGTILDSAYWLKFDEAFMTICDKMIVLTLNGWRESKGIAREMNFFKEQNKTICYVSPEELQIL